MGGWSKLATTGPENMMIQRERREVYTGRQRQSTRSNLPERQGFFIGRDFVNKMTGQKNPLIFYFHYLLLHVCQE